MLIVVEADGTERTLIDPMAIDPSGTTTLDTWQPDKEGDLLAYQLSVGGNEESVLYVMDVATGEIVEGPIDRAATPPSPGCPAARRSTTCAGSRPSWCRTGEEQFHRRVYLHRVGTDPETTCSSSATA